MNTDIPGKSIRWWPVLIILMLAAGATLGIWTLGDSHRQERLIRTAITAMATLVMLLTWVLLFSRMRWQARVALLISAFGIIAFAALNFQIRGVTGDLIPIVEWKWQKTKSLPMPINLSPNLASETTTNQPSRLNLNFPQYMGEARDGKVSGLILNPDWVSTPPQLLWKKEAGPAWSGFALAGHLAITLEQRGEMEALVAYDILTGNPAWVEADEAKYSTTIAGEGPRSTPSISGGRVFAYGATGILKCVDLLTGQTQWKTDTAKEHTAGIPSWGFSSSPLVHGGKVYVFTGGPHQRALVCYNAEDGKFEWGAGDGGPEYSSPLFANLAGVPQILIFQSAFWACSLDGEKLWSNPWPGNQPRVSLPVLAGDDRVLISSGYGAGVELLKIIKGENGILTPERIWKSNALKSKFGPIFIHENYIYALDDGIFVCVELSTGNRVWKDGRYGHGQGLMVGKHILLTTEKGEIVLIEPISAELKEVARMRAFDDKTWNPPALAGEYLVVRNHREAACYKLSMLNVKK